MGSSTCQFGEDDLFHNSREQADIRIASLQRTVLLKAVEQQRLKPEHVLEVCTLRLDRGRTEMYFISFPVSFLQKAKSQHRHTLSFPHLKRTPCDQLKANQGVKEFGQTEADISISVAVCIFSPPDFEMGFNAVKGMKVLHRILKYFLTFPEDAIWMRGKVTQVLMFECQFANSLT